MSASKSTPALKRSFRRFFRSEHEGNNRKPCCHWTEFPEEGDRIRCNKPASDVGGALEDLLDLEELLDLENLNGEAGLFHVPEYIYKRALCEHHQAAYLHLCNKHSDKTSQNDSMESEASYGDHSGHHWIEALDHDSNKELLELAARRDEERDKEEVLDKANVSQGREKRIDIYNNDFRVLVDISTHGLDGPSSALYDKKTSLSTDARSHCELTSNEGTTSNPLPDHDSSAVPNTPQKFVAPPLASHDSASRKRQMKDHMGKSPGRRNLKASETLSADSSYEYDVADNEKLVRRQLQAPLVTKGRFSREEGFVYALRDEALGLVKIGSTYRDVFVRKTEIERRCNILRGLSLVGFEKVLAYERLEQIIQQDLAPHRWFFNCECGKQTTKQGFTRHQEWFQVDNNTLLRTLRFWAGFVKSYPWTPHPGEDQKFLLRNEWHKKLSVTQNVKSDERHDDHSMREERWRKLLGLNELGVFETTFSKALVLRPAASRDDTNGPCVATLSLPDSTPSKPPRSLVVKPSGAHSSLGIQTHETQRSKASPSSEISPRPHSRTESRSPISANLPGHSKTPGVHTSMQQAAAETPGAEKDNSSLLGGRVPPLIFGRSHSTSVLQDVKFAQDPSVGHWNFDFGSFGQGQTPYRPKVEPAIATVKLSDRRRPLDHQAPTISSLDRKRPESAAKAQITDSESEGRSGEANSLNTGDVEERQRQQPESASSVPDVSNCKKIPDDAAFSSDRLVQSLSELVTQHLAKEARPLPARTISADLWQLRWPLACSISLALQSPHIPPALSLVIWSVFLPFFVAELRGWTGEGLT